MLPAAEYISKLDDGVERSKCIDTLARLSTEKEKAHRGMAVLEEADDAQAALERLESMARQLSSCGGTKLTIDALSHLQERQDKFGPGGVAEGTFTSRVVDPSSPEATQQSEVCNNRFEQVAENRSAADNSTKKPKNDKLDRFRHKSEKYQMLKLSNMCTI